MFTTTTLFIGALLDALIGPNLLVPGEPFMLAAGYQLYDGIYSALFAVLLGGLIGDQLSFWIGYRVGAPVQNKLLRIFPKARRTFARCRLLMRKKGNYVLVFARLLGPVAWVVPFMAGSHKISWIRFTLFSSVGLLLGIGQFVFWGYLAAMGLNELPLLNDVHIFIVEHQYTLLALLVFMVTIYVGYKRKWRHLWIKSLSMLLAALLYTNYSHFFWLSDDFTNVVNTEQQLQGTQIKPSEYKAYPGKSAYFNAQAINITYQGESPKALMQQLGWIENKTFSRNDIEWNDYLQLLQSNTPPVSDLFWRGIPQDMAFQLPGNLMKRNHIRWWYVGTQGEMQEKLWVGAVSYDNGLKITPYAGILTILHKIDPNVDLERDSIATAIDNNLSGWAINYTQPVAEIMLDNQHDYYSDGRVLTIREASAYALTSAATVQTMPL